LPLPVCPDCFEGVAIFNPAEVRFYDWEDVDFRYNPARDEEE